MFLRLTDKGLVQYPEALALRRIAGRREHRGLADPGQSLDYEDVALALQRPLQVLPDKPELSITFKQQAIIRAHPNTINRCSGLWPEPATELAQGDARAEEAVRWRHCRSSSKRGNVCFEQRATHVGDVDDAGQASVAGERQVPAMAARHEPGRVADACRGRDDSRAAGHHTAKLNGIKLRGRRLWLPSGTALVPDDVSRLPKLQSSTEGAVTLRIPRRQLPGQSRAVRGYPSRNRRRSQPW